MTLHKHDPMSWPITLATAAALPSDVTTVSLFQRYWLSDLKVMAIAYGDHWEYSQIPSRTWANILAIASTSLKSGMTCRASDLSLHTFIWDGTYWQSLNEAWVHLGSSRTSVTISGSTSIDWQGAYSGIALPANLLGVGGKLRLDYKILFGTKSSNGKGIRLRVGTSTQLIARLSGSAQYQGMSGSLLAHFDSAKSAVIGTDTTGTSLPFYTAASTATADTTTALTLAVDGVAYSSSESITMYGYDLYAERRAA